MKSMCVLLVLVLAASFLACAHKKAYKRAIELESAGRYVEAAEQDLEALEKKPEYEDALAHLRLVAPSAYNELRARAESQEASAAWIEAVESWRHLERLLGRFRRFNVSVQTIDVSARISEAIRRGRDHYYEAAQQRFQAGELRRAIEQFKNVKNIAGYHRDTKEKLWECHMRLGEQNLSAGQFQVALGFYESALEYGDDRAATKQSIAETHYQWGLALEEDAEFRNSTETFERALEVVPGYRDAAACRERVFEKALTRIAILPFKNSTSHDDQYSSLLTEELINGCIKANLKYAVFITRADLAQILEEYRLAAAGVVDEAKATEIGRIEGIHFFVSGNLTQISEQTTRPSYVDKTHDISYTERDQAGNEVTKTRRITYREYVSKRTIQLATSYQIVDVETGRYVTGNSFTEVVTDEARYVRYQGNTNDLPQDKRKLLEAGTEPRAAGIMINEGLHRVVKKMSQEITTRFR